MDKIFRFYSLIREAYAPYKWKIVGMAILSFFSSLLEGIGINAVIPLFSFIGKEQGGSLDSVSKFIRDLFYFFGIGFSIKYLLIFIGLLFIVRSLLLFIAQYISVRTFSEYERSVRSRLFSTFLESNWAHLSKQKLGHFDQLLLADVKQCSVLLSKFPVMSQVMANLVIYSFLAINVSPSITFLALAAGIAAFLVYKPLFYKSRAVSGENIATHKELVHHLNESLIGMKSIKSNSIEKQIWQRAAYYFDAIKKFRIKMELFKNFANGSLGLFPPFFIIGIFIFSYKTSLFNFAAFAVIIYAISKIFDSIQLMVLEFQNMSSEAPSLINISNFKKEVMRHKEEDEGARDFNFTNRLEFENVSFAYDGLSNQVLKNISFSIKKGEMAGLVGPSGTGKTTMVDLLLRLLKPQKGQILLDGESVSDIKLSQWRKNIGYVPQEPFLINDTIENNIKFYNDSLGQEEIAEAARMANIRDFIESQPQKFQTSVGERGVQLSGGQKQRVVLARILARKPQFLILDEATSSLDNESEMMIQRSIEELRGKITVLAIAHRLSTVLNFDKVFVMENGQIVEFGKPRELLDNKNSHFFKIYNLKK